MSAGTAPGLSPRGDYDLSNPVGSFVDVVRRVVVKPAEFFSRIPRRGTNAPLIFALICIEISTILGGFLRLTLGPQVVGGLRFAEQMGYGVGGFIAAIIFTPIGATIGLFIGAGILHLFVMLFVGEGNSGYEATFRVISYASVTSGSTPLNRGHAARAASTSHFGLLPRHLGISVGGTHKLINSSTDQR